MLFDEIKEILSAQLEIDEDEIEMTSKLSDDLGADSLDMIDIVMTVEEQYSVEVPDETIKSIKNVEDLVSYIENNLD